MSSFVGVIRVAPDGRLLPALRGKGSANEASRLYCRFDAARLCSTNPARPVVELRRIHQGETLGKLQKADRPHVTCDGLVPANSIERTRWFHFIAENARQT